MIQVAMIGDVYQILPDRIALSHIMRIALTGNIDVSIMQNKRHPVTGEYSYKCDCSFAADVSTYARHECEHSAMVLCESNKRNRES